MLRWLKKISSNTQGEYWISIDDMPLYNWLKCNEGDLKFARKSDKGTSENDIKSWEILYNEYLKVFGINKKYEKYLIACKKRAKLQAEYVITKIKFRITEIEIQNAKIKALELYFGGGQDVDVILMWVSKFLGYKVSKKETTVKEYFTLLKEYGKANKKVGNSRKGSV